MSSPSVFTGSWVLATTTIVKKANGVTASKSFSGSYPPPRGKKGAGWTRLEVLLGVVAELAIERLVGGDRAGAARHKGVAVRGRLGAHGGSDISAGARVIVDHDGLAHRLAHLVEH